MNEREIKDRIRIRRENRDRGWRSILADPLTREALWELYEECMRQRDVVQKPDGDVSEALSFRAMGKRAMGDWIANRCMLADHKQWLLTQAEHDRPIDDGRQADKQQQSESEEE